MAIHEEDWELQPRDQELRAFWIDLGSSMEEDAAWQRILWLIHEKLELVKRGEGRNALYRDPKDGRLWALAYDHPELKDGGPPRLTCVDQEGA